MMCASKREDLVVKEQINIWLMHKMIMHSNIFPTASHVLMHTFFCNGNGYQGKFESGVFSQVLHCNELNTVEECRRAVIDSLEADRHRFNDVNMPDASERHNENIDLQIEHIKNVSFDEIICTSSYEDMLNDVKCMFEYNREQMKHFRRVVEDYRDLCDGFPTSGQFYTYTEDQKYRYIPVFGLLKDGMNKEFLQVFLWFSCAILQVYKEMESTETDQKYKDFMRNNIVAFEQFMKDCMVFVK